MSKGAFDCLLTRFESSKTSKPKSEGTKPVFRYKSAKLPRTSSGNVLDHVMKPIFVIWVKEPSCDGMLGVATDLEWYDRKHDQTN